MYLRFFFGRFVKMSQVVAEGVQSRGFSRITPLLGIGDLSVAVVCVCALWQNR